MLANILQSIDLNSYLFTLNTRSLECGTNSTNMNIFQPPHVNLLHVALTIKLLIGTVNVPMSTELIDFLTGPLLVCEAVQFTELSLTTQSLLANLNIYSLRLKASIEFILATIGSIMQMAFASHNMTFICNCISRSDVILK